MPTVPHRSLRSVEIKFPFWMEVAKEILSSLLHVASHRKTFSDDTALQRDLDE